MIAKIASYVVGGVFVLASAQVIADLDKREHPASEGKRFLVEQGVCTDVQGGEEASFFNACGKSIMSRTYTCKDKADRPVSRTVCFGLGKYLQPFGN